MTKRSLVGALVRAGARRPVLLPDRDEVDCATPDHPLACKPAADLQRLGGDLGRVLVVGGKAAAEGYESASVVDEVTAAELGTRLAERLLREGAERILSEVRMAAVPLIGEP